MVKDTCILCSDVNIEYRSNYIEGAGQMCKKCYDGNGDITSIPIPTSVIKDTPNDMELGELVRVMYYQHLK